MDAATTRREPPRSAQRDGHDQKRLRHAREQHAGFPTGQYLQPPPMLFTRDGHNVFLGDMYRGHAAFLICAGPSLKTHDLSLLERRGILTMAVNNAASVYRPHLWCSVDDPGNFCDAIWYDPGILKFIPMCHMEKSFLIRDESDELVPGPHVVGDAPAVFGFRRNESFQAEQWLHEDTFNWGNHSRQIDAYGNKGSRSVMYIALRLLFYLGVRRLYLLGCDFRMEQGKPNYAFEQDRSRSSVRGNNATYRVMNVRLQHLKPHFDREGFEVFNCTPDSGLTVFPHVPFDEAVRQARSVIPERIVTAGMYDRAARKRNNGDNGRPVAAGREVRQPAVPAPSSRPDLPEMTLVLVAGRRSLRFLSHTWPTWLACYPWLSRLPVLVIHSTGVSARDRLPGCARRHPQLHFVAAPPDELVDGRTGDVRPAALRLAADFVATPWYLKLEADAVATGCPGWPPGDWFAPDEQQRPPAYIASRWSYTKPADALSRLDAWGDTVPGLKEFPRLSLPFDPSADRIRHPTISSWCLFANTARVREIAQYLTPETPCATEATFLAYCCARRQEHVRRVPMKEYGWDHSFKRPLRRTMQICRHVLNLIGIPAQ